MSKHVHEIRDPIHVFVYLTEDERRVVASRPFQRLRHIHQLALSYQLYPAASHKRFEHSLGVAELAGRVFDVVTHPANVSDEIRHLFPDLADKDKVGYWRRVLRMAALCHDMGHLPFSHAAERELLPQGWDHERLTREIILSPEMTEIWHSMTPPLRSEDVVKLALGPEKADDLNFTKWEATLSEIIVGDAFGVDRMDYLLRDSHHTGVVYGKFDHVRLIDTLRFVPWSPPARLNRGTAPFLGVEEGGLKSAEALLLARYFMYSQVYFHPLRRIYDIHLKDFLRSWLPGGAFPTQLESHLQWTDNEVNAAILEAAREPARAGHDPARRIAAHDYFKILYQPHPHDQRIHRNPAAAVFAAARNEFGETNVVHDSYKPQEAPPDFPVRMKDERIASSVELSETLRRVPVAAVDCVYINPTIHSLAGVWLRDNRAALLGKHAEAT